MKNIIVLAAFFTSIATLANIKAGLEIGLGRTTNALALADTSRFIGEFVNLKPQINGQFELGDKALYVGSLDVGVKFFLNDSVLSELADDKNFTLSNGLVYFFNDSIDLGVNFSIIGAEDRTTDPSGGANGIAEKLIQYKLSTSLTHYLGNLSTEIKLSHQIRNNKTDTSTDNSDPFLYEDDVKETEGSLKFIYEEEGLGTLELKNYLRISNYDEKPSLFTNGLSASPADVLTGILTETAETYNYGAELKASFKIQDVQIAPKFKYEKQDDRIFGGEDADTIGGGIALTFFITEKLNLALNYDYARTRYDFYRSIPGTLLSPERLDKITNYGAKLTATLSDNIELGVSYKLSDNDTNYIIDQMKDETVLTSFKFNY